MSSAGAADEETSTSSPDVFIEPTATLEEFRQNWKRELKIVGSDSDEQAHAKPQETNTTAEANIALMPQENNIADATATEADQQLLAEGLFRKAVELEQRGKVYDALPLYKKALHIVPDIELLFYEKLKITHGAEKSNAKQLALGAGAALNDDVYQAEEPIADLYKKFEQDVSRDYGGKMLLSNRDAGVIGTELHISDLPPEILFYIMRWVASTQLDMRSVEQCAAVCKGMYLCARDDELWRLACKKIWGYQVGTLTEPNEIEETEKTGTPCYLSWRQMFVERPRVHFHGCYISKTTYMRMGENSFQDQYYRPVQLVEYYRYMRFLPGGTVLMMTTAEEPAQAVAKLRNAHQTRPEVKRGHFLLYGNTVSVLMQKKHLASSGYVRARRGSMAIADDGANTMQYILEFRIGSTSKRKFAQLNWLLYSVIEMRQNVENTADFELTPSKYPPLYFSPVRSYHLDADAALA